MCRKRWSFLRSSRVKILAPWRGWKPGLMSAEGIQFEPWRYLLSVEINARSQRSIFRPNREKAAATNEDILIIPAAGARLNLFSIALCSGRARLYSRLREEELQAAGQRCNHVPGRQHESVVFTEHSSRVIVQRRNWREICRFRQNRSTHKT